MTSDSPSIDVDRVYFGRYLATINEALRELRRRTGAAAGLSALRSRFDQREFVVVLVGASRDGQARFGCRLSDLEFLCLDQVPSDPAGCWFVRREHVWDALERPWRYLADPSRIELPPFGALAAPAPADGRPRAPKPVFGPNPQESGRPKATASGLH